MPSEARSATPVPAEEGAAGGAKSSASAADEGGRGGPTAPIARSAASALWLGSFFAETRCSQGAGCSRGWERYPISGFFFGGGGGVESSSLSFFFARVVVAARTTKPVCLFLSLRTLWDRVLRFVPLLGPGGRFLDGIALVLVARRGHFLFCFFRGESGERERGERSETK